MERVLAAGVTLDTALASLELHRLTGAEQSQVKALAYGALRWHHRHRVMLKQLLERPLPASQRLLEALLSVGLYQLGADRQPEYATVSATVEAARWLGKPRAVGLVNAMLRRFQREREALLRSTLANEEGRYSHPQWLIDRLRKDWPDRWQELLEAAVAPPPLWLRVNRNRTTPAAYQQRLLTETGISATALDGFPDALKLSEPLPVMRIPGFADGWVTVQDAGSQLAVEFLAPEPGMRVLDACAAPGGKATHLLERTGGDLDLLVLDKDAGRMDRVRENLGRLGLAAQAVVGDACRPDDWWDGRPFDRILLDAPCSGTGVIRRHPDIKLLRRESDIGPMAAQQGKLLARLWTLLSPGGRLLYATCSVLRQENDQVVAGFRRLHPDALAVALPDTKMPGGIRRGSAPELQLLPGPADTDGLYYALMARQPAQVTDN